ncbi:MAG: ECF transporter S component [Candidatus Thorarchaeota archaeon]|jgi:uncharacterized membrane protein
MLEYFVPKYHHRALYLAMIATFTALTTVATIVFIVPFPSTQGYFNLGDTFVMLSGFLLGPMGGFFAGGVGSAMGDALLGFPVFAPITFIAKGFEGFLVGLLSSRTRSKDRVSGWDVLGLILGSLAMLMGYLFGEMFLLGFTFAVAVVELVAINSIQVIMGSIFAIAVGPLLRMYLQEHLSQNSMATEEESISPEEIVQ